MALPLISFFNHVPKDNDRELTADSRELRGYDTWTETFAILIREPDKHSKVLLKIH